MYQRPCEVSHCKLTTSASTWSKYCDLHRRTNTRHGHPTQLPVRVIRLRSYLRLVEARYKANPSSEVWTILCNRWAIVIQDSVQTVEAYFSGSISIKHRVQAAHQVSTLAAHCAPMDVVKIVLAMYLLADMEPRTFRSEKGFEYQMVRRVLRLAPVNAGSYWNPKAQRVTKVYRDLPPRAVEALADLLKAAFGPAGNQLAYTERHRVDPAEAESQRLANAIEALS